MMEGRQDWWRAARTPAVKASTADRAPPRMTPWGGQEGHEVCEAVAEQGARLADGGGHFGDAVARGGQELGIVLVDEAGLGQVDADRVR